MVTADVSTVLLYVNVKLLLLQQVKKAAFVSTRWKGFAVAVGMKFAVVSSDRKVAVGRKLLLLRLSYKLLLLKIGKLLLLRKVETFLLLLRQVETFLLLLRQVETFLLLLRQVETFLLLLRQVETFLLLLRQVETFLLLLRQVVHVRRLKNVEYETDSVGEEVFRSAMRFLRGGLQGGFPEEAEPHLGQPYQHIYYPASH